MEELRKSGKLNDEAMEKLDKKYNLLEKMSLEKMSFGEYIPEEQNTNQKHQNQKF